MPKQQTEEDKLLKAALAIFTILTKGSGRLTTVETGETVLLELETGRAFVVDPRLMDYMVENDFIVEEKEGETNGLNS